ncbi:MAG: hypothetical protein ACOYEV_11430 [Candidatus Nanopelagicales bacterium]
MIAHRWGSLLLVVGSMLAGGCGCTGQETPSPGAVASSAAGSAADSAAVQQLRAATDEVLGALADQDYVALAELVHPATGVRFAPYGFVDVEEGVALTPEQVAGLGEDDDVFTWGSDPGSGDPLKLTFAQYNERFVYDQQFLHAEEVAVNRSLSEGSSLDNTADAFPGAQFVDYHFPGFDDQYGGLDWETLRVVMSEQAGRWYLVGLVHDSWTP